ncbi:MAG: peptidoglycan-binding protein [Candidatus Yonathbacteria bacterium]|nr:peptidoglycan-binding protein [Candidatus Yonathbacteria bacterium]
MFPGFVMAQVTTNADVDISGQTVAPSCVDLSNNMRYRMRDTNTNGEVSDLQDFLNSEGFLSYLPTGFFGLATLKAVKDFQSASGFSPTGFVGPLTRGKIKAMTCEGATSADYLDTNGSSPITGAPVQTNISTTITTNTVASSSVPHITSIEYFAGSNGVSEKFVIRGNNFSTGSVLQYTDTLDPSRSATLTANSINPFVNNLKYTEFLGDKYTGNMPSIYEVKVVDSQGHLSNKMIIDTQAPAISISPSPETPLSGQDITLKWSTTNATSCSAYSSPYNSLWTGGIATSGTQSVGNIYQTTTYTIVCKSENGVSNNIKFTLTPRG